MDTLGISPSSHFLYWLSPKTKKLNIQSANIPSKQVKAIRKQYNLTQIELSKKSGVGLRFVRELEQGKQTLRVDKVNQILNQFGSEVGVVQINIT